ncbi:MAG: DUF2809 domain-containing protein, partial [Phycisphaerales bacterium]
MEWSKSDLKIRIFVLVCFAISIAGGFWMWRYYRGAAQYWIRFYVSGSVYVLMWSLLFFFFWPTKSNTIRIPAFVLLGTCLLEFLQLWKPGFLQQIRSTLIGAGILGTDFVW